MAEEYETFYDAIKEINGTLYVSIDKKLATFSGLKKGDVVKVLIRKEKGD